jgi:hypothetical protein
MRAARGPTAQFLRNAAGNWVTVDRDGQRMIMDPSMFTHLLYAAGLPRCWAQQNNIILVNLPQQYRAGAA